MTEALRQAAQAALEALEFYPVTVNHWKAVLLPAAETLRAALAQPPAQLVSDHEYLALFDNARAGSDRPVGIIRGVRACIAAYEAAQPPAPTAQPAESTTGQPLRSICWANCPCRKAAQPVQQPGAEPVYSKALNEFRREAPAQRQPLTPDALLDLAECLRPLLSNSDAWGMAKEYGRTVMNECAAAWGVKLASTNTGETAP